MARHLIDFTYISAVFSSINTHPDRRAKQDAWLLNLRNRFRTELATTTFVVSDLFQWAGSTFSTIIGTAFIVKNGTQEWMIAFVDGTSTNSSTVGLDKIFSSGDTATLRDSFNEVDGDNTTSIERAGLAIHYNSRKGSYSVGFDDAGTLTFTGGDFSAPATSPWTDFVAFMPDASALKGVAFNTAFYNSNITAFQVRFFCVFDDTLEFLSVYTAQSDPNITQINMLGSLLTPYDDLDLNKEAVFYHELDFNVSSGITGSSLVTEFYNPNDATISERAEDSQIHANFDFRYGSVPRTDGTYPWDTVELYSNNTFKGWFHRDILRLMGAATSPVDYYRVFPTDSGPMIKLHRRFVYPWVPNKTRPPFPDTDPRKGFDYRNE